MPLQVRMERHNLSSLEIAKYLESHPKVIKVNHPLLESSPFRNLAEAQNGGRHSGMIGFYLKGGKDEAVELLDKVRIITRAASLGGSHSLICHPCSLTHSQLTEAERETSLVTDNLIRLSIGLENVQDLINDLDQALAAI